LPLPGGLDESLFRSARSFRARATILCAPIVHAQEKPAPAPKPKQIAIRAGRLIDGKSDTPIANALILIEGDKIVSVTPVELLPREWN